MTFNRCGSRYTVNRLFIFPLAISLTFAGCGGPAYRPFPPVESRVPYVRTDAVPELIAQLGSDDWRVRDEAQARLIGVGPAAVPMLRRAAEAPGVDPEVASRIRAALHRVERFSPTLVSLDVKGEHPREVFRQLAEQAGVTFTYADLRRPGVLPVTIRLEGVPFWDAVQRVCRASRTSPGQWGNPHAIHIRGDSFPFADRSCVSGPLFVTANGVNRLVDGSLLMDLWVYVDPKVEVVRGPFRVRITDVRDEHGRPLPQAGAATQVAADGEFALRAPDGADWLWLIKVPFAPIPADARELASVRGTVPLEVRSTAAPWTIDRPVEQASVGAATGAGPWRMVFRGMAELPDGNGWRFDVDLERGERRGQEMLAVQRYLDALRVEAFSESGGMYPRGPRELGSAPDGSRFKFSLSFSPPADAPDPAVPPARLVFHLPTEVLKLDVPFEFADMPVHGRQLR